MWRFPLTVPVLLHCSQATPVNGLGQYGGESSVACEEFITLFRRLHAPEGREVSERLLAVQRGNRRAAEYALEFGSLTAERDRSRRLSGVLPCNWH